MNTRSNKSEGSGLRLLDGVMALTGVVALACLLAQVGWRLDMQARVIVETLTRAVLVVFVGQEAIRHYQAKRWVYFVRQRWMETTVAVLSTLILLLERPLFEWLRSQMQESSLGGIALLYLGFSQVPVIVALFIRVVRYSRILEQRKVSPGMLMIGSFAGVILLGALLLLMPNAMAQDVSFIDSLFVSTSAVCVTGLSPVDISVCYTFTGQCIILALIQVGGLGVITLTYFFAIVFAQGISLRDRVLMVELLSEDNVQQISMILFAVIGTVITIELAGSWLVFNSLPAADAPLGARVFSAFFHSISAFCNAGFSIYSGNLADPLVAGNVGLQCTIMLMIVLGGIGFPVLKELGLAIVKRFVKLFKRTVERPPRISTHSRLAILTTLLLLFGGTIVLFTTEYFSGMAKFTPYDIITAMFNSVTCRTAGFNTVAIEVLAPATALIMMVLMFIGGSPASTAGGIKTTTFAVAVLDTIRILKDRPNLEIFYRRISDEHTNRALAIILLAASWVVIAASLLMVLHPKLPPFELLFETISAFGTVGLTRAITAQLSDAGKIVIIITMFIGRIGILLFAVSLLKPEEQGNIKFPEAPVLLN
ncbi:MAG: potassium transporter TrkG [Verrucomicrobiota bacterium]|nr:potassium transporter TrkG [Verrucomicrobiota bacterium]